MKNKIAWCRHPHTHDIVWLNMKGVTLLQAYIQVRTTFQIAQPLPWILQA